MNSSQESSSGRSAGVPRNLPGLLGEVDQDGGRIEDARFLAARAVGVDDRRHLAVRVDGPEGGRVLLALAGIDGDGLVGQAGLLQEERDLRGVRCRVKIEADHRSLLLICGIDGSRRAGVGLAASSTPTTMTAMASV